MACDKLAKGGCGAHSNCIVDLHMFRDIAGVNTGRFSTAGWDGRVITWDISKLATIKAVHA